MITYISLFLGAVSAIVGALLSPKVKGEHGKEKYSPWAAVFVVLPLVAFGVAAWDSRNKDAEQKQQITNLDTQLKTANKLTASLERQAELSNDVIRGLQSRVETSIRRVDVIEARVTYSFTLKEAGFDPELPRLLHGLMLGEVVAYDGGTGKLREGVISNMFDFVPLPENYARVNELMSIGLAKMSVFEAPRLMIRKRSNSKDELHNLAQKAIDVIWGISLFREQRLPREIATYSMTNPRLLDAIPPLYIALAQESWFIPDRKAEDPTVKLTWRFRFLNNQTVGLITADDFRDAEVEVYAGRPNPNYDHSASTMFFRSPFGEVINVEASAGGSAFKWEKNAKLKDEIIVRYRDSKGETTEVGQLVRLKQEQPKQTR